ncbi:MAG: general secretion pathway protein GspB [Pseudomonadota bacterium]
MSFILDALKKSEAERNRKSGPVLMDMRIAPARRQLPTWVWVIAVVLLANLALLGYALLRGGAKNAPANPQVAASAAASAPSGPPLTGAVSSGALPPPMLPAAAPTAPAAPATGGVIMQSNAVVSPANAATGTSAASTSASSTVANTAADFGNLPSDDDLRATGLALPELHLSLHVYDDVAANRFVLLNSSRLREGQETADGVMVERIDPADVVLSWRGRRFRMHPGN